MKDGEAEVRCKECGNQIKATKNFCESCGAEIKRKDMKKCPVIVLCLLFALWLFIIPLILGIILYIRNVMIDRLQKNLKSELENQIETRKNELDQLNQNIESITAELKEKARSDVLAEMELALEEHNKHLSDIKAEINVLESKKEELFSAIEPLQKKVSTQEMKMHKCKLIVQSLQYAIKAYEEGSESYLQEALLQVSDENLSPIVELHLNCMNIKKLKKLYSQNQKLIQDVYKKYESRYTTKTNRTIYRLMVLALAAELQNVLFRISYGKLEDSIEAVKNITSRYLTYASDGNQNIVGTVKKFIGEIEYLFIEAVKIEYEYYKQKERIKEEQRALREQMRQEKEEQKLLEQQKVLVEKEETKYRVEIEQLNSQKATTKDTVKIKQLEERIAQLQAQLQDVETKKEEISNLQNGKAGYVYIISNLGSFGENVFKIGMTRRLDPMERVKELGDASVPFPFDVHSFIFSDDAVSLESTLHAKFEKQRVNKVNTRKEFFKVSIDEIEKAVNKYDPTAEFNRTMLAEQYYQSISDIGYGDNSHEFDDEEVYSSDPLVAKTT